MSHFMMQLDAERTLVFGLTWAPVVGSNTKAKGRAKARKSRATHYVHDSSSAAVGTLRLTSQETRMMRRAQGKTFSAAQAFALAHPHDKAIIRAQLDDRHVWIASVQDGRVIADGDRVHVRDADNDRNWDEYIAQVRREYPSAVVVDACGDETRFSFADLLRGDLVAQHLLGLELRQVGQGLSDRQRTYLLASLVLACGYFAWQQWQAHQARERARQAAAREVDPVQAWSEAAAAWQRRLVVEDPTTIKHLVDQIGSTPLHVGGWKLTRMSCVANAGWSCTASYTRTRGATNLTFIDAKPASWREHWITLDEATATWQFDSARKPASPLPQAVDLATAVSSSVQLVQPAFTKAAIGPTTPVVIPPPTDSIGQAIPRELAGNAVPQYIRRSFDLSGPMRSLLVLPTLPVDKMALTLSGVELSVAENAQSTLTSSPLQATVKGFLHAVQK